MNNRHRAILTGSDCDLLPPGYAYLLPAPAPIAPGLDEPRRVYPDREWPRWSRHSGMPGRLATIKCADLVAYVAETRDGPRGPEWRLVVVVVAPPLIQMEPQLIHECFIPAGCVPVREALCLLTSQAVLALRHRGRA